MAKKKNSALMSSSMPDGVMEAVMSGMSGLKNRILFVLMILFVYRFGTYVPIPGINSVALAEFMKVQSNGVLGLFNVFTGGSLSRMSIFALNIIPYITASIVVQVLSVFSTRLGEIKKDGEAGRIKINQYTRYLTLFLAIFQGYGLSSSICMLSTASGSLVSISPLLFKISATINLTGGTMLVVWMAEQINAKGIGNGSSVIIFAGIVAGLPSSIYSLFEMGRIGSISTPTLLFILALLVGLIFLILICEKANRKVLIHYPKRQIGNKLYNSQSSHIPIKLNVSGVIPAIFASSLLLLPISISGFLGENLSSWQQFIHTYLGHGKPLYIFTYAILIFVFAFFYTSIIFNSTEIADNLKKQGGIVLGRRPGSHTANYLDSIVSRVTFIGASYLLFICVLPEVLISQYGIPFALGGTSLLIMVSVVIDLITQVQTHLLGSNYDKFIK